MLFVYCLSKFIFVWALFVQLLIFNQVLFFQKLLVRVQFVCFILIVLNIVHSTKYFTPVGFTRYCAVHGFSVLYACTLYCLSVHTTVHPYLVLYTHLSINHLYSVLYKFTQYCTIVPSTAHLYSIRYTCHQYCAPVLSTLNM